MLLALYLTTSLAAADTSLAAAPALEERARPAIAVLRQTSIPLVALRLSILADDPPGYSGAGHMIQHIVHARLRDQVGRVGGRVRLERSSDAVIFSVTGPAEELDFLSAAVRSVLEPPRATEVELIRASQELAEERLAEWETAGRHVRAALRAQLFPGDLPAAGTDASAARLTRRGGLDAAWSLLYRPERVSIVAVGDVRIRDVEAAFERLPAPLEAVVASPDPEVTRVDKPLAPPQATRGWLATGYLADDLSPAAVTLATRLAGDLLRARLPTASVDAEHWWSHHGHALVLVVAVPRGEIPEARAALATALRDARRAVAPRRLELAANRLRREMLFYSRTPDRMVEVVGGFLDRDGEAGSAQQFYTELEDLSTRDVARALDELMDRTAVQAEVPPQTLPGS
jgi:predicted Zn-dependent peptidase